MGFRINMPILTNEQMQAKVKKTLTPAEMQAKLKGTTTPVQKSGGIFSSIAGFARGMAKTPLKAIGTAQTALEAGGQFITGQTGKAAETISKGSERMRQMEKELGYGEGEISTPYKIGTDIADQQKGKGAFGKETLKTVAAGAELASYGMGAPQAGAALKAGMATKGALGKTALLAAKREAVAGMVGGAGMAAQEEDATLGGVLGGAAAGGALGFVGGGLAPYAGKALKGAKSWLTLSDEAVAKAMQAENKVDVATPFINRTAKKVEEAPLLTKSLNEIDDVLHAPPATDAVPVSDVNRRRAKSLGLTDSYINNVHEMSHVDAVDAREALDMAHMKEKDTFAPDPNMKTGEGIAKVIHAVQDIRKESGALLDPSIAALPNKPLALDEVAEHVNSWLNDRDIRVTYDQEGGATLDFTNSKFAGPAASADRAAIQEAFDVATMNGQVAQMTPKQIRTARQRLRLTSEKAAGPASVPFDTETKVLIDGVRKYMDKPLQVLSPEYAAASMKYAKAMNALTDIYKYLGSKFIGKEEERITGRLAEVLPRLLSNAGETSAMAVDDLLRIAKEIGVDPALLRDPKRLVIFNEGLDNIFDIVPKRSLAGQVNLGISGNEAIGTMTDIAKRNYMSLADRAYNKIVGEPNVRQRKIIRDMLDEKIAEGEKRAMAAAPSITPEGGVGQAVEEVAQKLETPKAEIAPEAGKDLYAAHPDFEQAKGLSPENAALQDAAFAKIAKEKDAILADYTVKKGNVVNPDDFKPYFKDIGYAGHNSAGVQEPSSYMAKQAWKQGLGNEGEYATLYAGGSGSGKTSAIKDIPEIQGVKGKSAVVWDGNLSNYASAQKKIKEALAAGKQSPIIYVYRDPMESFTEGVVKRSLTNPDEMGRIVPSKIVAGNHIGSWEVASKLHDEGHTVFAIDNSFGWDTKAKKSKAKLVPFETLKGRVKYPSETELTSKLNAEAKRLLDEGTITPEQYTGYTGESIAKEAISPTLEKVIKRPWVTGGSATTRFSYPDTSLPETLQIEKELGQSVRSDELSKALDKADIKEKENALAQAKKMVAHRKAESPKAKAVAAPLKNADGYLYHGTNQDVIESILKEGLKPMRRGELSLSKDEAYASSFAREGMTPRGKTNSVLLRVKRDLLDGKTIPSSKPRPKSDQLYEILTKDSIPPESLEMFKNGRWQPLLKKPKK